MGNEKDRWDWVEGVFHNAVWDSIKKLWGWGYPILLPVVFGLIQKIRHVHIDWMGLGILTVLSFIFFLLVWSKRKSLHMVSREPPSQTQKLKVLSAKYGAYKEEGDDVTETLQKLIANDTLSVMVNNDLFGDPAIGKAKRLRVSYSYGSPAVVKIERRESDLMVLPEDTFLKEQAKNNHAQGPTPPRAGPPSPKELREQTLALAGDLCALLIGYGEPLDPPPVDDGYAGLGPLPPDDPKIENAVVRSFSSRISDVRSHLGERGLLGESFNFSSFGDALNGSRVRNANGVRVIIKCLEQAAKKIDERFISGVPFAFASSPSRATDLRALKEETFQLVWELKEFYKSLSPCPGGDESLKDGTTEGLLRFGISHVDAIGAWSSKIRHEYAAKFSVRVTDSLHKLGSKGLDVRELEQHSKSIQTNENVSNVIEALQKLASEIEGT